MDFVLLAFFVCALIAGGGEATAHRNSTKEEKIHFSKPANFPGGDFTPKCAAKNGGAFCELYHRYPYKRVVKILRRTKPSKSLFVSDVPQVVLASRFFDEQKEQSVCPSRPTTVFPQLGKTRRNAWKIIVNQKMKDGYVQGVNVEICNSPDQPCDLLEDVRSGIVTFCRQKYAYKKLVTLTDEGSTTMEEFLMPTACCCTYREDVKFYSRFGMG